MKTLCVLFLIPTLLFSQNNAKQNAQVFACNVALGAIIGGTSELISNPRHVKPLHAFIHGFCSGSIGGAFNYAGKYYSGAVIAKGKYGFVLPCKLLTSLGNSIIYNTGHSEHYYFQYVNFDYGFIQINADVISRKLSAKVLPGAVGGIVGSICVGGKFDLKHSLLMGTACFTKFDQDKLTRGFTCITSITVNSNPLVKCQDSVRAHEYIHVLQCLEYNNFSNIVLGWNSSYRANTRAWKYLSLDLPYSDGAYFLNSSFLTTNKYGDNYFEFEARRMSRQTTIPAN